MWDFVTNNMIGAVALAIMFYSVVLQFSYIKFRRKAVEEKAKITEIIKHKFWQLAVIEFMANNSAQRAYSLCFKNKKPAGSEVDIFYNPKDIGKVDKSVLIKPLLEKLNLKKESKLYVVMKHQNRSILHLSMIIFSLILMTFS